MTKPSCIRRLAQATALPLLAAFACNLAWADKPDWAGHGKNRGMDERHAQQERHARQPMVELRFSDGDRRFIHDYYGAQVRGGHCPPGLAKKHNGCMPPGQARNWAVGRPLPADLRRYPLPPEVLIRLPMPPAGHEFVRVASDILLIAVGTGMVIDAVEDLGR